MKTPYTWNNANFTWKNANFNWNDVYFIIQQIENSGGVSGGGLESIPDEDKKKLIKVILSLNGVDYTDSKTDFNSYKVTSDDIEMVKAELKVRIDVNDIKIT